MLSSLHLWDYPQYRPVCYPIWRWNWNWKQDGFWQETSTVSESLSLPHPPKTNTASDISSGSRSNPTRHQRTLYVSCQFLPVLISKTFFFIVIQWNQTTTSFVHTTQIHLMPVSPPPITQQKPIHAFDLSKLHMIFFEDARYRRTLTVPHPHLHGILILTCMKWLGDGEHIMRVGIISEKQSGRKASVDQSRRGRSGTKMERRRDSYFYLEWWYVSLYPHTAFFKMFWTKKNISFFFFSIYRHWWEVYSPVFRWHSSL